MLSNGKTLVVTNPASQSGNGAKIALYAEKVFYETFPQAEHEFVLTENSDHARAVATAGEGYDTVIAIGGDGHIHDVVNGLMRLDGEKRPVLGVVPVGTGNDYARTLGMDFAADKAIEQLIGASVKPFDIGCCNGEWFVETISFGLDAAIALDTVERRERTGKTGTQVFLASGIDMLLHNLHEYEFEACFDGGLPQEGRMILFAVQVGVTYGGGFMICPDARTDDGLLDVCIAHPPLSIPKAVMIFLLAKNARHTGFKQIEFKQAKHISLGFKGKCPPIQIDGEPFAGSQFDITSIPAAVRVLVP